MRFRALTTPTETDGGRSVLGTIARPSAIAHWPIRRSAFGAVAGIGRSDASILSSVTIRV